MLRQNKSAFILLFLTKNDLSFISYLLIILFATSTSIAQTNIINAFPNITISNPIDIQHAKDNSNRLFLVSQSGKIHVFNNDRNVSATTIFLDISDKTIFSGEQGLLGLAFHPEYKSNGYFYLNYTTNNPRRTVISRFAVSLSDPNFADSTSELILLEVEQPFSNHNGGQIAFGPDGYLYISFGDGGSGGDPGNRAQNLSTLLGKIIRINVDQVETDKNYSIPDDNPFKGNSENYAEEIFAYGLRNVWKFSFDNDNNLWAADVGQNAWEEISLIVNGGNYGWRIMEGSHCYNPQSGCNEEELILPVWEYGHSSNGGFSITGGFVYEGTNVPELLNNYIYADFVTGNIWSFDLSTQSNTFVTKFAGQISTFGIDSSNDLYFADYNNGSIYKFIDDNINSVRTLSPNSIKLHQNYPNPFNPSTTISYEISNSHLGNNYVSLDIFNAIGEKVAVLVNENQGNGTYSVEFNTEIANKSVINSGVYFYRLKTNDFLEIKKMIVLN